MTIPSGVRTLQSIPLIASHYRSPRQAAFTL